MNTREILFFKVLTEFNAPIMDSVKHIVCKKGVLLFVIMDTKYNYAYVRGEGDKFHKTVLSPEFLLINKKILKKVDI